MSASGRAIEFMRAWGEGHNKPHNPRCKEWGADDCDACIAEAYDPYEALVHAADIMGWRPPDPEPGTTLCGVEPPSSLLGYGPCDSPAGRNSAAAGHIHTWPWQPRSSDPAGPDTGVADSDRGQ